MKRKSRQPAVEALLPHVSLSRRKFAKRLLGATFAVPAMMSFPLDSVALGSATLGAATVYPTQASTLQQSYSSPANKYYCVPEDPSFRAFSSTSRG